MKRTINIVILLLLVVGLRAQQLTSYTCDFENPAENAQWVLNTGYGASPTKNKWYVGPAGSFGLNSSNGLYISGGVGPDSLVNNYVNDLGRSPGEFIATYRQLDLADGQYTLVFDWMGVGSANDGLYVFWINPADEPKTPPFVGIYSYNSAATPPNYCAAAVKRGGKSAWTSESVTFTVSGGQGGKLVAVWFTMKGAAPSNPAPAIDNICIYQGTCSAPTNVAYDGNTSSLTWSGDANSYDVVMYNLHSKATTSYENITTNSLVLGALTDEGMYRFYVRANGSDTQHSKWVYAEKFVWIKGARCIDIFDLTPDNSGAAKCYWTDGGGGYGSDDYDNEPWTAGQVLAPGGADDENSRHVIHYRQDETDPRTNNLLRTIPEGEIASIRINGFWNSAGHKASRIEYEYPVQSGVSDLLVLKYAAVLEDGGHEESVQPRFKLEILDRNNRPVDPCAQCDFRPKYGETQTWHTSGDRQEISWCDWQTITISLRDYAGSTLKIRLTAYDCTQTAHFGYAYFTLNCKGGDLQGIACNDFSTDHFEVPEGFNYRWYKEEDPGTVLATTQRFDIAPNDTSIYLVDMISKTKPQCYYTLEANPNPRFPQAKASVFSTKAEQCQQVVEFDQNCHVVRINRQTLDSVLTKELVEDIVWDFGDGSAPEFTMDEKVTHTYPATGGTFNVTVKATMSNGICEDVYTFPVTLPDITTPTVRKAMHHCETGNDYVDTVPQVNTYGCDYDSIISHYYHLPYDTTYTDRICEGGRYFFPGDKKYYTVSTDTTLALQSIYGCDSLISLKLIVDPKLEVEYPHSVKACLEDGLFSMPYRTISGSMDSIWIYFSAEDQQQGFEPVYRFANGEEVIIPLPAGARPDLYDVEVEFGGERCQMEIQPLQLMVTYPTSIVMQNGGFIATQNADYNGGHEFVSFTWYKDGEKLDHTASYLPTSPSDIGSTFVLSLMRAGENYAVESCPILYSPATQGIDLLGADAFRVWPTSVEGGGTVYRSAGAACTVYTVLGTPVASFPKTDVVSSFAAPSQSGMYIVVFDNHQSLPIIVR